MVKCGNVWGTSTSVSSLLGWLVSTALIAHHSTQYSLLSTEWSIYHSAIYTLPYLALYWATYSAQLQLNSLSSNLTASGGACDRGCDEPRLHHKPNQRLFVQSEMSRVCSVECSVDCWVVNTLFSAEQWVLCRMLSNNCCWRPERAGCYPPLLLSCLLCDWLAGRACYSSGVNA